MRDTFDLDIEIFSEAEGTHHKTLCPEDGKAQTQMHLEDEDSLDEGVLSPRLDGHSWDVGRAFETTQENSYEEWQVQGSDSGLPERRKRISDDELSNT